MRHLHAGLARGQRGGDAGGRRSPDRGVRELAGIGARVVDDVGPLLELAVRPYDRAELVARKIDDVGEILERIERHLLHVRQPEHRQRDLDDGVAVGLGRRHNGRSDSAARTRLVVDDDRLAELLRRDLGETAKQEVGGNAGGKGHHQRDRPIGKIGRRLGPRRSRKCNGQHRCKQSTDYAHNSLPSTGVRNALSLHATKSIRDCDLQLQRAQMRASQGHAAALRTR